MKKENSCQKALTSAFNIIARRDHSLCELKDKLIRKGFDLEDAEKAILRLQELDYLDDTRYAEGLIRYNQSIKRLGPVRIRLLLLRKGIHDDIISKAFDCYSTELEQENLKHIIHYKTNAGESKEKIFRYLIQKGYNYESFSELLRETFNSKNES